MACQPFEYLNQHNECINCAYVCYPCHFEGFGCVECDELCPDFLNDDATSETTTHGNIFYTPDILNITFGTRSQDDNAVSPLSPFFILACAFCIIFAIAVVLWPLKYKFQEKPRSLQTRNHIGGDLSFIEQTQHGMTLPQYARSAADGNSRHPNGTMSHTTEEEDGIRSSEVSSGPPDRKASADGSSSPLISRSSSNDGTREERAVQPTSGGHNSFEPREDAVIQMSN